MRFTCKTVSLCGMVSLTVTSAVSNTLLTAESISEDGLLSVHKILWLVEPYQMHW